MPATDSRVKPILAFLGLIVQRGYLQHLAEQSKTDAAVRSLLKQLGPRAASQARPTRQRRCCTTEALKLLVSMTLEVKSRDFEERPLGRSLILAIWRDVLVVRRKETLNLAFPAFLYSIVNACTYIGISSLE